MNIQIKKYSCLNQTGRIKYAKNSLVNFVPLREAKQTICVIALTTVAILTFSSCSKFNPNHLPSVSPAQFAGKIEGFDSSGQVQPDHLVAYWGFNGSEAESKTGTAPTLSSNASLVSGGVIGQALQLDSGYVYYAHQFPTFDTSLKSFTISEWVQVQNNGSTPTSTFSLLRPGKLFGYINFLLETGQHPASDTNDLVVHPTFVDQNGNTQDNLNASWLKSYKSPSIPPGKWTHLVITYDYPSNVFQIWADGIMIGAPDYQNRGKNYFTCREPNEVSIGGWYNNIPGKQVTADKWTMPMKGKIDEIRVYNEALGAADIIALYKLGLAGK